jgi:hypothetical protein
MDARRQPERPFHPGEITMINETPERLLAVERELKLIEEHYDFKGRHRTSGDWGRLEDFLLTTARRAVSELGWYMDQKTLAREEAD